MKVGEAEIRMVETMYYNESTGVVGLEGMTLDEFGQGVALRQGSALIPYCSLWRQI